MALIYMDSFDHYEAADASPGKGWTLGSAGTIISSATYRSGGQSLQVDPTGNGRRGRNLPSDYATIVCGFAMRHAGAFNGATIFRLEDNGTLHVSFNIQSTGRLRAVQGNGTTLGTGTIVMLLNTWYYIEIKVTISDASGVVVTKINGVTDLNLSSQDTRNGGNASVNQIQFEQGASGTNFDDLYILDTTGGAPTNDFLGDCRVEAILPNGNGNSSQFDGSDGNSTDNYLLVDDTAAIDDDTTYVESPDVNDKDTYAFGNLVTTAGTVYGVQPTPYCRKDTPGARNIQTVARLSATETNGPTKFVTDTYTFIPDIRETKPGGGVWTVSDVNSAEFGIQVVA